METINDRMEMLINERFNGNKAAFAKSIGLPPTGLSNYLGTKRRSKPSVDMVTKIVVSLNVDALWLLTGEGQSASDQRAITVSGNNNQLNEAGAHNNFNMAAPAHDDALLSERVKSLEALLAEKERLIKVLMETRK